MNLFRSGVWAIVAIVAVAGLAPSSARADFTLTLHQDGFSDVTITDTGDGVIAVNQSFGSFLLQLDIATSNAASGVSPAYLTINTFSLQNFGSTGTLRITIQDTGFTAPSIGSAMVTTRLSTTMLSPGGTVTERTLLDGTQVGDTLSLSSGFGAASTSGYTTIGSNPYTLTNITTITLNSGGLLQSTGTSSVVAAPAPTGLILVATALPFAGFLRRRFKGADASIAA